MGELVESGVDYCRTHHGIRNEDERWCDMVDDDDPDQVCPECEGSGLTPDGDDCEACVGIGHTPCDLTPLAYAPATKEGGDDLPPCVTVDEIDQQRTLGWPDFHPEDYCHRCGGRNVPSWTVDSDRFNTAFGPPWEHPYNGIVCPGCFVDAHERATGMRATWALVPLETTPFRWLDGEPERRGCPAPSTEETNDD